MKKKYLLLLFSTVLVIFLILYKCNKVNYYTIERKNHIESFTDKFGKVRIDYLNNIITQGGIVISVIDTTVIIRRNGKILK